MSDRYSTAQRCERAFYEAFNTADADLMASIWATHSPLLCIHPGGEPLRDRETIMDSWRQILGNASAVRFEVSDHLIVEGQDVCVRHVHENIHHGPNLRAVAVVLATNVFVREATGWRLCTHHASPAPTQDASPRATSSATMH